MQVKIIEKIIAKQKIKFLSFITCIAWLCSSPHFELNLFTLNYIFKPITKNSNLYYYYEEVK